MTQHIRVFVCPGRSYAQWGFLSTELFENFDEYDSGNFAGYRFSEQDFMTMSEYLDARSYGTRSNGNGKEMYTVNLNKHFRKLELSSYINFSREPMGPANYRPL